MAKKETKQEKKVVAKKDSKAAAPKRAEAKKTVKEEPKKKAAAKEEAVKVSKAYHVSKREDGKWQVKLAKGKVAIKLFDTKTEALEYTKVMSENQGAAVRFHASKGAKKGKIRKF